AGIRRRGRPPAGMYARPQEREPRLISRNVLAPAIMWGTVALSGTLAQTVFLLDGSPSLVLRARCRCSRVFGHACCTGRMARNRGSGGAGVIAGAGRVQSA